MITSELNASPISREIRGMTAVFIYSTGRCGTQWFTKNFADNLGSQAEVVHEPIGARWAPRIALRHPDLAALRREMPDIDRHLDHISEVVATGRTYVETGWPAMAWYPYLKSMLGDGFRWVHVVRNPIFVAGSLATHQCYQPESPLYDREFGELAYLEPTDRGVAFGETKEEWASLTQFEKCLYQWLEVNRYGIDLADIPGLKPAVVTRFEDVFSGDDARVREIYRAVGLPAPTSVDLSLVDKFRRRVPLSPEVTSEKLWREVEAVGLRFGYESDRLQPESNLKSVSRHFSDYKRNARGAKGFKKARRMVKAMVLGMFGR